MPVVDVSGDISSRRAGCHRGNLAWREDRAVRVHVYALPYMGPAWDNGLIRFRLLTSLDTRSQLRAMRYRLKDVGSARLPISCGTLAGRAFHASASEFVGKQHSSAKGRPSAGVATRQLLGDGGHAEQGGQPLPEVDDLHVRGLTVDELGNRDRQVAEPIDE
jgi:hypothetical protein